MSNVLTVRKAMIAAAAVSVLSFVLGVAAVRAASLQATSRPLMGGMPSDTDGDGLVSDSGPETVPEFVRAVGDHGVEGYVRMSEIEGVEPTSPDEAMQESFELKQVRVYGSDLVTVVDTLTESPANPLGEAAVARVAPGR